MPWGGREVGNCSHLDILKRKSKLKIVLPVIGIIAIVKHFDN
jgi:hypothetical protein